MANNHPESIFSSTTWKGSENEHGNGGLRNLHGLFSWLLFRHHLDRRENTKTLEQQAIRRQAADTNYFNSIFKIGSSIKNNEYITPEEKKTWERVNYDINKEVLRGILRIFDKIVLKQKKTHPCLKNKQSSMTEIFEYIQNHLKEIREWDEFELIQRYLEKVGTDIEKSVESIITKKETTPNSFE